ncbi:MAG: SHOCT domain-containing protein [Nitrososphaeraceae archaeon]|nr:SHOCT domain-containing protein [Nitrososphaeraceae archaeon]
MCNKAVKGENDQEGIIEAIPKDKAEDLIEIIRSGMDARDTKSLPSKKQKYDNNPNKSIDPSSKKSAYLADELLKLAKMREEGIINEKEFNQLKQKLIS